MGTRVRKSPSSSSSFSVSEQRRRHLQLQYKGKRRDKLSQEKFEKMWNLTQKKQNKVAKIRLPPRELKPANINEIDENELAALPETVSLHHI